MVAAFPELYGLSLYGATLRADDLEQIGRLTRLRSLNLMAASASSEGLRFLGRTCPLQTHSLTLGAKPSNNDFAPSFNRRVLIVENDACRPASSSRLV